MNGGIKNMDFELRTALYDRHVREYEECNQRRLEQKSNVSEALAKKMHRECLNKLSKVYYLFSTDPLKLPHPPKLN